MIAKIYISYKDGILDPQGQAIESALSSIGIEKISSVRMGKYLEMRIDNVSREEAIKITDESCKKLLANPNTEKYKYELVEE